MSINLTDKQYLMLSQLAYLDFATKDEFYDPDNGYVGQTLGQMAERLLQLDATGQPRVFDSSGGLNDVEYHALLRSITEDSALSNLTLTGFENKNTTTGFVAYAFENTSTGDTCFAFRGSEGGPPVGSIDWLDNYLYGAANTSIQFTDVENFVNTYKSSGQIYVTGHSKGGANAAYACAAIEGCTGVTFDAPGIGETLNLTQVASLNNSGLVNYVAQGDLVGALLFHPETVKFVQQLGSFWAAGEIQGTGLFDGHYMQAFAFDGANLIEASRTIESLIIEGYSKTIWFLKNFNTNNPDAVVQLLSELGVADDIGDFINGISKTVTDINSYLQNSMSVGYEFSKYWEIHCIGNLLISFFGKVPLTHFALFSPKPKSPAPLFFWI